MTAIAQKTVTVYMHFYYSVLKSGNATEKIHKDFRAAVIKRKRAVKEFRKDKNVSFWKGRVKMAVFSCRSGFLIFLKAHTTLKAIKTFKEDFL